MRHFLICLCFLIGLGARAFAQTPDDYQKSFDAGLDALTAGRYDEGIAAFKKCLELAPEEPICAYNVACGYAKKAEKDSVFEWLDKAAGWGFGNQYDVTGLSNLAYCQSDTDLTQMHDDPRWAKFVEKLTLLRKPLDEFVATPAIYIPKSLEGATEFPLLVVLHDVGKSKNTVIEGRWKN